MSDAANNPVTSQVILVALSDLYDPDWNPRDSFEEEEMQSLMDYINAGRLGVPPIIIWTPSPENAGGENPGAPWAVISGKRRREAYRRLGRTHIEAIPMDIPLEDAMFMALAANRDSKPFWLHEYIRVEKLMKRNRNLKQVDIIAKSGWKKGRVSQAVNLTKLLNQASRELILQYTGQKVRTPNFSGDEANPKPDQKRIWRFTEDVGIQLIPLWDENNLESSQSRTLQAVRTIIDKQLTSSQTQDLVAHILSGGDLAEFAPKATVRKARAPKKPSPEPETGSPAGTSTPIGSQHASPQKMGTSTPPGSQHADISKAVSEAEPKSTGDPDNLVFWEWMAGISFISQLRSKLKKKESLSNGEKVFLFTYRFFEGCGKAAKFIFKLLGEGLNIFVKFLKAADKLMVDLFGHTFAKIVHLALAVALVWGILYVVHQGVVRTVSVAVSKVFSMALGHFSAPVQSATPVPTAVPASTNANASGGHPTQMLRGAGRPIFAQKQTKATSPAVIASTAVKPFTEGAQDLQTLGIEFATVPMNSVIEACDIQVDTAMGVDMSTSRIGDTSDPNKYTLMIGHDKKVDVQVANSFTKFVIHYDDDTPVPFVNKNHIWDSYWIDLKEFHVNVIETLTSNGTKKVYQFTIISSDQKQPLTFQCATKGDLEHLVSGLEVWAKSTRSGNAIPIVGMPYVNQGLKLDKDGQVVTLWAGSPIGQTKLKLGDYFYSMKGRDEQQKPAEIEAALQALAPGDDKGFMVTGANWKQAKDDQIATKSEVFAPYVNTLRLTVPNRASEVSAK